MQSQEEKVRDLLNQFHSAMLVTRGVEGLRARPMAIASVNPMCISFFTSFDSPKVDEVLSHPEVLVTLQKNSSLCVSLTGTALISRDKNRIAAKWKESFAAWFPNGVDDPNLTLIDVFPTRVEYWDSTGLNKVKYILEAARAYVTGTESRIQEGEQHGVVRT